MKGSSLIFLIIVVIAIYALMILPQKRQQKQKAEMMRKLAPGNKVLTASGIYAQVVEIRDSAIVTEIASGVEVEMDPRAIVRVVSQTNAAPVQSTKEEVVEEDSASETE